MTTFRQFVAGKLAYVDSTTRGFGSLFFSRLSYKSSGITFLVLLFAFYEVVFPRLSFAFSTPFQAINLISPIEPKTTSLFREQSSIKTLELKFTHKTIVDKTLEPGQSKVVQFGLSGRRVVKTIVIFHQDKEFSRENIILEEKPAIEEILAVGVDPDEKTLETPYGTIKYRKKITAWATSYDFTCPGCNQTTSIGLKAGYGVVAVDPAVIPLRSKVYVPGYGIAIAGDTGGSIKGNKIDLGFDSLQNSTWTSRFTDVYLISQ